MVFLLLMALFFFALVLFLYHAIDLEDGSPSTAYAMPTIKGDEVIEDGAYSRLRGWRRRRTQGWRQTVNMRLEAATTNARLEAMMTAKARLEVVMTVKVRLEAMVNRRGVEQRWIAGNDGGALVWRGRVAFLERGREF